MGIEVPVGGILRPAGGESVSPLEQLQHEIVFQAVDALPRLPQGRTTESCPCTAILEPHPLRFCVAKLAVLVVQEQGARGHRSQSRQQMDEARTREEL